MTVAELQFLSKSMAPVVTDLVRKAVAETDRAWRTKVAALEERLLEIETRPPAVGPIGPPGPQGEKGDVGTIGPIGPPGEKGEKGATAASPQFRFSVDREDGELSLHTLGEDGIWHLQSLGRVIGTRGEKGEIGPAGADGRPGEPGPQGEAGKDAPPVDTDALVSAVIARLPAPEKGERGEPGPPGKDAPEVNVEALVSRVAAMVPIPKDGVDGVNGKDGRDGIDGKDGAPGERGEKGDAADPVVLEPVRKEIKTLVDRLVNLESKTLLAQRLETDVALALRRIESVESRAKKSDSDVIQLAELPAVFTDALASALAEVSTWQPGS